MACMEYADKARDIFAPASDIKMGDAYPAEQSSEDPPDPAGSVITSGEEASGAERAEPECVTGTGQPHGEMVLQPVTYHYLVDETGEALPAENICWDEDTLAVGTIVRIDTAAESPHGGRHYRVQSLEASGGISEEVTVRLTEARSGVWKMGVLALLLLAGWYAVEYALAFFW